MSIKTDEQYAAVEDIEHARLTLAVLDVDRRSPPESPKHQAVKDEAEELMMRALEKLGAGR